MMKLHNFGDNDRIQCAIIIGKVWQRSCCNTSQGVAPSKVFQGVGRQGSESHRAAECLRRKPELPQGFAYIALQ